MPLRFFCAFITQAFFTHKIKRMSSPYAAFLAKNNNNHNTCSNCDSRRFPHSEWRMHRGPGQKQRDGGGCRGWKAKENCLQLPDKIASQLSGISRAVTPPYCFSTYADRLVLAKTHTYRFPAHSKSTGVSVFANLLFKLSRPIQIPMSQQECVGCISFRMMHMILRSLAIPTGVLTICATCSDCATSH